MEQLSRNYHILFEDKTIFRHIVFSIALFIVGLFAIMFAYNYALEVNVTVATDLILDNVPVFHVGKIFFISLLILAILPFAFSIYNPRKMPFIFISTALFLLTRAFFMILTHLTPPNVEYYQYIIHRGNVDNVLFTLSSGTDLFFSGHTGYPFLLALIYWNNRIMRYFFLAFSVSMAAVVLLGHLHYSIDVFSAYFIVFGIFKFAQYYFKKEYAFSLAS